MTRVKDLIDLETWVREETQYKNHPQARRRSPAFSILLSAADEPATTAVANAGKKLDPTQRPRV